MAIILNYRIYKQVKKHINGIIKKMEKTILFDIDGTLFDSHKFGSLIREEFVKILGIDEEELIRANADYYSKLESSTDFLPRDITSFISERFNASEEDLNRVFWENDRIYKESLYPETIGVLKELSEKNILGIFSQGDEELQARKLNACDISQFFDRSKLFVYKRKLLDEVLGALPKDALFVDDKHDVVTTLAKARDVVWINRRNEEVDPLIRTVHSLDELLI